MHERKLQPDLINAINFMQDDGNVEGRCQRHREAPAKLDAALADLSKQNPNFVLHLGDIVNGGVTDEATKNELELIAGIFDKHLVRA